MKRCSKCKEEKELGQFVNDKHCKLGKTAQCKTCRSKNQKKWALANPKVLKETNDRNKEKRKKFYDSPEGILCSRRAHLRRTYGITIDQYNEMLNQQKSSCKICGGTATYDRYGVLAVDHNHNTGAIRGLLCGKCNKGLGSFNDSIDLLQKAIDYLNEY